MPLLNPKVKSMFSIFVDEVDYVTDIISFSLSSEQLPQEQVTFKKYTAGNAVKWKLKVRAAFDGGSNGSLHSFLWDNAGMSCTFTLKPFQEIDPVSKRIYQGMIRLPYRPDIKIAAGKESVYDYEFTVLGQPSRGDQPNGFMIAGYYDTY